MLPTPSTKHICFDNIYEPAEDSFLLLDALSHNSETSFLKNTFRAPSQTPLVVEVGTGSGVVLAFVTRNAKFIFGRADVLTLGTDINPLACHAARETVHAAIDVTHHPAESDGRHAIPPEHGILLDTVRADLASTLRKGNVDVLIFNPPYVPTADLPQTILNEGGSDEVDGANFKRDSHLLAL
jgi:release factor glutamine methyltransferase